MMESASTVAASGTGNYQVAATVTALGTFSAIGTFTASAELQY